MERGGRTEKSCEGMMDGKSEIKRNFERAMEEKERRGYEGPAVCVQVRVNE